ITGALLLVFGVNPLRGFGAMIEGAFGDASRTTNVIAFWVPLTLASAGLVVTFTAGLWNIGIEGQIVMGALAASWLALKLDAPAGVLVPLEILAAMGAGALWAALAGVLKTRGKVHEIFGGLALNSIAIILTNYLISGPWQPPEGGTFRGTQPFPPKALLPLVGDTRLSILSVIMAIVAVVGVYYLLKGTYWGLRLKALGKNPRSASLLGVSSERELLLAMMFCGALAGLGGSVRVLSWFDSLRQSISGGIGFLALLVVMLSNFRVLWTPFIAIFFSAVLNGSIILQLRTQLHSSLGGILTGVMVLLVLLFGDIRSLGILPKISRRSPDMNDSELIRILSSIVLLSAPLMIAVCGETITERAGVVNLSLDGTMLLSAMTGFVGAYLTSSVFVGFVSGALVGMTFASIVSVGAIRLRKDQFAIGFVLTLLGDRLSAFLGQNFTRLPGPSVGHLGIPILKDIPILGPLFFDHDPVVYFAFLVVGISWLWIFRTQPGLRLRSAGERPETGFARGVDINRLRYFYTLLGGALVGIAGAAYSLDIKLGWSEGHVRGLGWITLAIVIFGGWSPLRGALGAILFGASKALAAALQRAFPEVSVVAFNAIPWVLMIGVLLLVGSDYTDRLIAIAPRRFRRQLRQILRVSSPKAIGTVFVPGESSET
ncbi:MAG: hypothetical protein ACE5M4_14630, partial [Anaerolineales bacterium]